MIPTPRRVHLYISACTFAAAHTLPISIFSKPYCFVLRNGTMLKIFNQIDIGERAGSGIPNIFRVWREQGWVTPIIEEGFEPERTTLSLVIKKSDDKKRR